MQLWLKPGFQLLQLRAVQFPQADGRRLPTGLDLQVARKQSSRTTIANYAGKRIGNRWQINRSTGATAFRDARCSAFRRL